MSDTTIILGLDPGTAITGFGILSYNKKLKYIAHGIIETPKTLPDAERLSSIRKQLQNIIKKFHPSFVAVERLFFTKNVKTAITVAQARGVLLETASTNKLPVYEYTPNEVKMALTGYGNATKGQVQIMVQRLLLLDEVPSPDDAADALAIAICCAHSK